MSYEDLLSIFWESHDPSEAPISRQYMSAIFYHDETQRQLAEQTKNEAEGILLSSVHTEILPVGPFHDAEDYHQKWFLRRHAVLVRDFGLLYPDPADFLGSTSATRVNGVAGTGRHYTLERLEADLPRFGLSEESNALLRSLVE